MTIFEVLAEQHGRVEALFREVQSALGANKDRVARARFQELSTTLIACMRTEHAIVYPRFAFLAGLDEEVTRAIREHDRIEQAINHLRLGALTPDLYQGALTRLQLLVADHVETEEWILFPVARLRLSTEDARKLADEFRAFQPVAAAAAAPSITYFVDDAACTRAHRDTERQAPVPPMFLVEAA
ncbi:MAG: hemerythrin domain-containing protein [Deltaproteobacteria bacterium]|nr:hemerythrin domain-containing protein [Deltaproteobacteria bacterium]